MKSGQLFQEIGRVLGAEGRLDVTSLGELHYLKACVPESLRLTPINFATGRRTSQANEHDSFPALVSLKLANFYINILVRSGAIVIDYVDNF
jgi:hypothetical protein